MATAAGSSVTKSELIERVSARTGMTKGRAEMVVSTIFDSMTDALVEGDGIEIRGFGSFTVRTYKSYEGRNPRTGAVVHVPPKKLPFFKVGKDLRERVNGKAGEALPRLDGDKPGGERRKPSASRGPSRRRDEKLSEDVI